MKIGNVASARWVTAKSGYFRAGTGDIKQTKELAARVEGECYGGHFKLRHGRIFHNTPGRTAAHLTEAFKTNDPVYIGHVLDTIARVRGIGDISIAIGLVKESLLETFKKVPSGGW